MEVDEGKRIQEPSEFSERIDESKDNSQGNVEDYQAKHIGSVDERSQDDVILEEDLSFIRDKVPPVKDKSLKPQEMERHITDLRNEVSDADRIDRSGRGTTIISLLRDDQIYTVSDGRNTVDYHIVEGNGKKLFNISEKFIGTVAGEVEFGKDRIDDIKKGFREKKDAEKIIKEMQDSADKKNAAYEVDKTVGFYRAQIGLNGFEGNKGHVLLVDGQKGEPFNLDLGGRHCRISVSGSGSLTALAHLNKFSDSVKLKTPSDVTSFLMQCIAASGCVDFDTGSCFQMGSLKKGEKVRIQDERPHLISVLAKDFEQLKDYFRYSMLHITSGIPYGGAGPFNEIAVQTYLKSHYKGIVYINILGVQLENKKVVRLIKFVNEESLELAMGAGKNSSEQRKGKKGKGKKGMSAQSKGNKNDMRLNAETLRPSKVVFRTLSDQFDSDCF